MCEHSWAVFATFTGTHACIFIPFYILKKNNPFEFRIVWHSCTELKVKKQHILIHVHVLYSLLSGIFFFFINLNTVNSSVLSWVVLGCFYNVVVHQRKTNYHKTARAFKEKKDYPEYSESIFRVHLKRKTYKSTLNQLHSIRQWKIYYISGFFLSKSEIKMDFALRYKMAKEVSQNRWKR